ncbi:MAG: hypothetical protein ACYC0V_11290 [Armatimonadota bacterium]
MTNNILDRFKLVEKTLDGTFQYVRAKISPSGKIVFDTGKGCMVLGWLFMLPACIIPAWFVFSPPGIEGFLQYLLLAISGFFAFCLVISARGFVVSYPYFEIDSDMRQFTIYGGFPIWRPKGSLRIEEIRLFVAYTCRMSENTDSSLYAVTESGLIHPLIPNLGSFIPDNTARTLGYICRKTAVSFKEYEPTQGTVGETFEKFKPKSGKLIDIQKLLSVSTTLYNSESTDPPDWVK